MDMTVPPVAPTATAAPRPSADLRPSADAAALARDPTPSLPLGPAFTPPSTPAQIAAVTQAVLAGTMIRPPAPVLRPFGIEMMTGLPPDLPARARAEAKADTGPRTKG